MTIYEVDDWVRVNDAPADPDHFGSVGEIRNEVGQVRVVGILAELPSGDTETVYNVEIRLPSGKSEMFSLAEHHLDPA